MATPPNPLDYLLGHMLGQLCGISDSSDTLITNEHKLVFIDNEHAFIDPSPDFSQPPLRFGNNLQPDEEIVAIKTELCKDVLALPNSVFQQAVQIPDGL
jgi:hypothetical protein